jgi:tight adherence protein C
MELNLLNIIVPAILVLIGIIFAIYAWIYSSSDVIDQRIKTFIGDSKEATSLSSMSDPHARGFSGNLYRRTMSAWFSKVITFLGKSVPIQSVEETNRRLTIAGNPYNIRAMQFYGLRLLILISLIPVAILIYFLNPSSITLLIGLILLMLGVLLPNFWLRSMMKKRQQSLERSMPNALDVLCICVSAGLSFDQAMQRVGQTYNNPIGEEFSRVISEMDLGITRKEALRNMQSRVEIPQLSSFIAVIIQSESIGMSISEVLQSQADQMRIHRQYKAKEIIQRLPAKMMIPLALLIFPALLAVILGPMLPYLQELLGAR